MKEEYSHQHRRWYDKDPVLSEAVRTLEETDDQTQIRVALNLIKIIIEHNIEDEKNLTFLYRAPKYFMEPLEFNEVKQSYMEILGVAEKDAGDMAKLTKGYPFAYQALGKYLWDAPKHKLTDAVIQKFDKALATYVYNKIWDEMSEKDRWYMNFISKKETMKTSELLELSGQNKSQFSQYRVRLSDKGIIDTGKRGIISIKLPRFAEFVQNKIELEI